ncbi:MAG TPA: apolipoprotein N-acyltransferase [Bacteroidia bacterium]|jgi:apolipoprotein N-acyltransferase|nr:apolipoprotein N-acyltransferase [Bacteroidia bacterium]
MNKKKIWSLSILSGILLGASWFSPLTFLIFTALVPLFFLTEEILVNSKRPKGAVFLFSYITFVIWNGIDTWWTWFASPGGAVMAVLANSLLMAFTYWVFFILYKSIDKRPVDSIQSPLANRLLHTGYWLLIPIWLSFEYLHTLWELAWTWLTLGNVFAFQHNWVQWYEYTGVSGGTLWILVMNILIFNLLQFKITIPVTFWSRYRIQIIGLVFVLPVLFSRLLLLTGTSALNEKRGENIVIVQPNIDPYNDKFNSTYESQLNLVYNRVKDKITNETNYLVLPETFFTENVWENNMEQSYSVKFLRDSILKKYPDLIIITGATTFYQYKSGEKHSLTAHRYTDVEEYYEVYNSGLQIDNYGPVKVYHKSKLVPGAERIPYPAIFKPLEKFAIDLGGTVGSLGTQEERSVLYNKNKSVGVAVVICYESVFGEYVTDYINKGANLIFIITNDGWWRDTPGYVQHLNYARLRAIETRMPVARCANTGISCFINEHGEISKETKWWEPAVIQSTLNPNNNKTFYVKYGDLISKAALVLALLSVLVVIFISGRKQAD